MISIDCISVIFPNFDFMLEYNQSSGHIKVNANVIIASNMNIYCSDKVFQIQTSVFKELGPYTPLSNLEDEWSVILYESSEGPSWIRAGERLESREENVLPGTITKDTTKADLLVDLHNSVVDTTLRGFLKPELVKMRLKNNIPISTTIENINPE